MKKFVLFILLFLLVLVGCEKNKTIDNTGEKLVEKNETASFISPDKNPRNLLESIGFWNKMFYRLDYNPLYGYCYQHLFPTMDTSQEKDVIAFHISSLLDPMVIFIVDKVAYNNSQYELTGKINDKKTTIYVKLLDEKTINVLFAEYGINESYDLASGIAYSSFIDSAFNQQEEPVFDIGVYDTCEDLDKKIISDISDKLTDNESQEVHGVDVKTDKGLDCWGKWANINDIEKVYYELSKEKMEFIDYSDAIYETGKVRVNKITDMAYKNGIFFFNSDDNELIGYMCMPIDNSSSMWILDDINLGIFKRFQ